MGCTTILVGKKASYDGSTMIARNDDGHFDIKKLVVYDPNGKKKYKSKISNVEIELPGSGYTFTATPNVDLSDGIWAASGINSLNVSMTATETISTNARVMGADPYVIKDGKKPGGIGEEDLVMLVLPYITSAREGVLRLGSLLETYGTYEPNGIAFADKDEIWWLETIGGHNFIARKVEDDEYVIMPNQFGLDRFDFLDAYSKGEKNLCSRGLKEMVEKYHLNLNLDGGFNPRLAFGSHNDGDHVYNTPRAWYMARYFNPTTYKWEGENADYTPISDNIPWSFKPEHKITVEDIKYILSSYYQTTKYNPYLKNGDERGIYRSIGINRTGTMAILQIRGYMPKEIMAVEWISFGSNTFNISLPIYTNTTKIPSYLSGTSKDIKLDNLYWNERIIAALADPNYSDSMIYIERYQNKVFNKGFELLNKYDELMIKNNDFSLINEANIKLCDMAKIETAKVLKEVLDVASVNMKNGFKRFDN